MAILVACEESQTLTNMLRLAGFEAFSCDLKPCSGGHPEYHIQGDVLPLLSQHWDAVVAHPPCTYLSYAAQRVWNSPGRSELRQAALDFFIACYNANSDFVAVENPCGYANTAFMPATQTIHPYYFGDPYKKRTCLWLRGFPQLESLYHLDSALCPSWVYQSYSNSGCRDRAEFRSKSFPGIARAMLNQWFLAPRGVQLDLFSCTKV